MRSSCKIKEQSIENALKKMKGVTILTTDATGMQNVVVENLKLWTYFYFLPLHYDVRQGDRRLLDLVDSTIRMSEFYIRRKFWPPSSNCCPPCPAKKSSAQALELETVGRVQS